MLRHRVTVLKDVSAEGADTPDWSGTFASDVPAWVQDVAGDKSPRHGQLEAHIATVVDMRWLAGLTTQHRIQFGDRQLNIVRILDRDGKRRWAEVHCREVEAA